MEATLLRLHFFIDGGANAKKVLYRLAKSNRCFGEFINVHLIILSVSFSQPSWLE